MRGPLNPPASIRPGFRWLLGATGLASVVALWWGEPPGATALPAGTSPPATSPMAATDLTGNTNVLTGTDRAASPPVPLPTTLLRPGIEQAARDLFNPVLPRPKPVAAPPPPPTPLMVVQAPPPPPPPPPMNWRYLGGVRAPDGRAMVYLGRDDEVVLAQAGATLPDGYRVEEVLRASPNDGLAVTEIRLVYPPLGHHETLRVSMPSSP